MFVKVYCSSLIVILNCIFVTGIPVLHFRHNSNKVTQKFNIELPSNETVQIFLTFKLFKPSKSLPLYRREQDSDEMYEAVTEELTTDAVTQQALKNSSSPILSELLSSTRKTTPHLLIYESQVTTEISQNDKKSSKEVNSFTSETTTSDSFTSETSTINNFVNNNERVSRRTTRSILNDEALLKRKDKAESFLITPQEAIETFRKNLIKQESEIGGIIEADQPFFRHFKLLFNHGIILTIRCTYNAYFREKSLTIECFEFRESGNQLILSNGEYQADALTSTPEFIDGRRMKQLYFMTIT